MFHIDNLTVVYLIGLVSLAYGAVQGLTLRDQHHSSRIWALSQILMGLGFIGLVYFGVDPLPKAWIGSYALLLLGVLIQLSAITRFSKNPIPVIPAASCLAALLGVVFLFEMAKELGAPLASLETFLFTPLAAVYIYMAWFSWKMGRIANSIYLTLNSAVFWLYAALLVLTLLLSLFDLGRGLININSNEIRILALASLALTLVSNYLWSIQAAQLSETDIQLLNFDIAMEAKAKAIPVFITAQSKQGQYKKPKKEAKVAGADDKAVALNTQAPLAIDPPMIKSDKPSKSAFIRQTITNFDELAVAEQEALVALLTEREKEVFILAADGIRNGQIAEALNSSESSIKVHRSRMAAKLGTGDIESLAKLKRNLGLSATAQLPLNIAVAKPAVELSQDAGEEGKSGDVKPPLAT
jgi:DNA-binding CsgD family transcriptional regulator